MLFTSPSHQKQSKGFTLLEVLIASVILFAAISVVTLIYSNVVDTTLKAERAIKITSTMPIVMETISNEISLAADKNDLEKSGTIGDVSFEWQAKKTITSRLRGDNLDGGEPPHFISLWDVTLSVQYQHILRTYAYREFSVE